MASFPLLFGAPAFGNEDRDQWIRVLTLFLQDPFKPMASSVGGNTSTLYGWSVPGEAITGTVPGSAIWRNNSYGIRELNEFSESDTIADSATMAISNRPAVLFVYSATDNYRAIYMLYGTTFANSNADLVWGNNTYWTTNAPTANRLSCYHDGADWVLDNQLGHSVTLYMCIVSLGDQVSS